MRTPFLLLAALLLFTASPSRALAQYAPTLPPGILAIEVDGQPIDSLNSPTTNNSIPEISGRADDSLPTIELAVADGDIVGFPATIGGSGRFRAVPPRELPDATYSLYVNDNFAGSFTIVGGTPGPRLPGALLDIARVVPYPADAAESLPGLAFLDGRFYSLSEEAARTASRSPDGPDASELERELATAGWLQRYENRLAVPNVDNPRAFDIQVSSFVIEYASGADARTAFDSLNSPDATDVSGVGDEAQQLLLSGVTPDTGSTYQAARLVLRVGPLLVVMFYADLLDQPPDLAVLESIATSVAERGRLVADRQVIPLGSMALRLDLGQAEPDVSVREVYDIRAGALTTVFGEDEDKRVGRADMLAGTTDAFTTSTSGIFSRTDSNRGERRANESTPVADQPDDAASPVPASPPATVNLTSSLYAFPSDSEADAWMASQENALLTNLSPAMTYERVNDAPALADAAAVFSASNVQEGRTELSGYRIFTRSGNIVAIVELTSDPPVSLRGAVGLTEEQLACIAAQGCAGNVSLPGSIFGARDRPAG